MAVFYVDYQQGADANDGLSFATRKRSLSSALAVPALTAGDEIRIKKSPEPTYIGESLWVPNSAVSVQLPDGTTQSIFLDGTWVAGANVTSTTSTTRKQGATSASLATGAGFTTGRIGYFATANLNLSAYSKLALWFFSTVATTGNVLSGVSLSLCSDAAGNTPVYTLSFPAAPLIANAWGAITLDNGSSFTNATSISSISLSTTAPGLLSRTFLIDNVIATNDVTFETAIGTNNSTDYNWNDLKPWYGIRSIANNQVRLDYGIGSGVQLGDSIYGFYGTTSATLSTYVLSCITIPTPLNYTTAANNFGNLLPKSGAVDNPIKITGGWNETDMSTRTGVSWLKPVVGCTQSTYMQPANNTNYWTVEYIGTYGFNGGFGQPTAGNISLSGITINNFHTYGTRNHITLQNTTGGNAAHQFLINECVATNLGSANTDTGAFLYSTTNQGMDYLSATNIFVTNSVSNYFLLNNFSQNCYMNNISCLNAVPATTNTGRAHIFFNGTNSSFNNLTLLNSIIAGLWMNRTINCRVDNARVSRMGFSGILNTNDSATTFFINTNNYYSNLNITFCGATAGAQDYAGFVSNIGNTYINNAYVGFCSGGSLGGGGIGVGVGGTTTHVQGLTTEGNIAFGGTSRGVMTNRTPQGNNGPVIYINNWKYSETSPAAVYSNYYDQKIVSVNDNLSDNTVITSDGGTISTDVAVIRPGGSNKSWKMSLLSTTRRSEYPLSQKIQNIYVEANKTYTASVYIYRTSNDVEASFTIPFAILKGINVQSTTTTSASLSAWEKLSLVFTPEQSGFMWFEVDAWLNTSSLTQSVYWTDFDITPRVSANITAGNYAIAALEGVYAGSTSFETSHLFC